MRSDVFVEGHGRCEPPERARVSSMNRCRPTFHTHRAALRNCQGTVQVWRYRNEPRRLPPRPARRDKNNSDLSAPWGRARSSASHRRRRRKSRGVLDRQTSQYADHSQGRILLAGNFPVHCYIKHAGVSLTLDMLPPTVRHGVLSLARRGIATSSCLGET